MGIIEPVEGQAPWVNSVVIVPKNNGEICLCVDMRQANQAIMRRRYPIPTVDEVLHTMNGSKVLSKLDLKWEYQQLELSPESREITTFATPDGLFRYKPLLFGVCSASEQYQMELLQPWQVLKVSKTFQMTLSCMALTQKYTTGDSTKL